MKIFSLAILMAAVLLPDSFTSITKADDLVGELRDICQHNSQNYYPFKDHLQTFARNPDVTQTQWLVLMVEAESCTNRQIWPRADIVCAALDFQKKQLVQSTALSSNECCQIPMMALGVLDDFYRLTGNHLEPEKGAPPSWPTREIIEKANELGLKGGGEQLFRQVPGYTNYLKRANEAESAWYQRKSARQSFAEVKEKLFGLGPISDTYSETIKKYIEQTSLPAGEKESLRQHLLK